MSYAEQIFIERSLCARHYAWWWWRCVLKQATEESALIKSLGQVGKEG